MSNVVSFPEVKEYIDIIMKFPSGEEDVIFSTTDEMRAAEFVRNFRKADFYDDRIFARLRRSYV